MRYSVKLQPEVDNALHGLKTKANRLTQRYAEFRYWRPLLRRPRHDPKTGQFVTDGLAAAKTLQHSEAFWQSVENVKADLVNRIEPDLSAADAAETKRGLIDGYAEARLFRAAMFRRLVDFGGPITSKGKSRALYTAYLGGAGS
jgi:hypothetical protein